MKYFFINLAKAIDFALFLILIQNSSCRSHTIKDCDKPQNHEMHAKENQDFKINIPDPDFTHSADLEKSLSSKLDEFTDGQNPHEEIPNIQNHADDQVIASDYPVENLRNNENVHNGDGSISENSGSKNSMSTVGESDPIFGDGENSNAEHVQMQPSLMGHNDKENHNENERNVEFKDSEVKDETHLTLDHPEGTGNLHNNDDHDDPHAVLEDRIINGVRTDAKHRPYQVLIKVYENIFHTGEFSLCGGAIYNKKFIITAAHCLHPTEGTERYPYMFIKIQMGKTNLREFDSGQQENSVIRTVTHPDYYPDDITSGNDIALIRVEKLIEYTDYIKPIALQDTPPKEQEVTISGWGFTQISYLDREDEPSIFSSVLQIAKVNILSRENCLKKILNFDMTRAYRKKSMRQSISKKFDLHIPHSGLCAYGEKTDACGGDSGGPMVCANGKLCGLVSFGLGCGMPIPGIYTDIYQFKSWIEENAGSSDAT